jgi:hypothetical protein
LKTHLTDHSDMIVSHNWPSTLKARKELYFEAIATTLFDAVNSGTADEVGLVEAASMIDSWIVMLCLDIATAPTTTPIVRLACADPFSTGWALSSIHYNSANPRIGELLRVSRSCVIKQ